MSSRDGVVTEYIVTEAAMRPASPYRGCFYCRQPIGEGHKSTCVLLNKKVKIRMTVEYEVDMPSHWDKGRVEFHRNEGTWCANNAIGELEELFDRDDRQECMCSSFKVGYLSEGTERFLREE